MIRQTGNRYDVFGYGDDSGVLYNLSKNELDDLLVELTEQTIKNEMEVLCVKSEKL